MKNDALGAAHRRVMQADAKRQKDLAGLREAAEALPLRVSFDLDGGDAEMLREVRRSFGELEPSFSQVAKMLLKAGLNEWRRGASGTNANKTPK